MTIGHFEETLDDVWDGRDLHENMEKRGGKAEDFVGNLGEFFNRLRKLEIKLWLIATR